VVLAAVVSVCEVDGFVSEPEAVEAVVPEAVSSYMSTSFREAISIGTEHAKTRRVTNNVDFITLFKTNIIRF
jgi:hypothetical protein